MQKTTQQGFSPTAIILTIVAVLAVIGVGWYAYQVSGNGGIQHPGSGASNSTTPPATVQASGDGLTLKEFGVKLKLPGNLSDLKYAHYPASDINGNHASVGFTSAALQQSDAACKNDTTGLGVLTQYKPDGTYASPVAGQTKPIAQTDAVKVGNYYYLYQPAPDSCATSPAAAAVANRQQADLKTALKDLQVAQ